MSANPKPRVAIIIPAYNEAGRIDNVLRAVTKSKLANEVIVVSDGSIDATVEVASRFTSVQVISLPTNQGKGAAMAAGAKATKADVIAFFDADLIGLMPEHVDAVLRPVLQDTCDMCVGIFRGGKFWSDTAQKFAPYISGQRAMRRWLFDGVPQLDEVRMGVEVSINAYAKMKHARVQRVILRGVANYHKEKKLGLVKGSKARIQMYSEIATAMVLLRKKRTRRRSGRSADFLILPEKPKKGGPADYGRHDSDR